MFETQAVQNSRSPIFGKIGVLSIVLFAGIIVLFVYLLQPGERVKVDLSGVLHEGDADYEWYEKYVELRDPKLQMGKNFAGSRMVMFAAVIENNGEKFLDVVEVELNFFNYEKLVWTTTRVPILPGTGSYTPPIEPLAQRGFTLYMDQIPSDWQASHAEMEIQGFRFSDQP